MANKEILIGADENGEGGIGVFRGTGVKDNPEYNTNSTPCFDEVVTDGAEEIGGTLEIEKLSYDSMDQYIALAKKLLQMRSVPTMVTTVEVIQYKGEEPYTIRKNYHDCIIDGNDYEMKPQEKSTRNLKFTYAKMTEKVNDIEIKLE